MGGGGGGGGVGVMWEGHMRDKLITGPVIQEDWTFTKMYLTFFRNDFINRVLPKRNLYLRNTSIKQCLTNEYVKYIK